MSFQRARQIGTGILLALTIFCAGGGMYTLQRTRVGLQESHEVLLSRRDHYSHLAILFDQLADELRQHEDDRTALLDGSLALCNQIRERIQALASIPMNDPSEQNRLKSIADHERQLRTIIYVYTESLEYRHTDNGREMRRRMQEMAGLSTRQANTHAAKLTAALDTQYQQQLSSIEQFLWLFGGFAVVAVGVGLAVSLGLTMVLSRQLLGILEGTQEFAAGNLQHRIPVTHDDEVGQLAAAINSMVEELDQRTNELQQSQKMEAVGRLAGGIAHDFNNLLTIIIGYCGILSEQMDDDSEDGILVREIGEAGERAASLTRQLLAFSRKQILQPRLLSLNEVVGDMDKMLRRLVGEHIEYTTRLEADPDRVKADPGQLEQVVMNLVVNARDAMPDGGKLVVETDNIVLSGTYRELNEDLPPGHYVMLAVSDNGVGMDDKTAALIFEPFFTSKEPGKGTGLGLSTVHGIVKQSGGTIQVHSAPGLGTTFKIYLPRASEAGQAWIAAPRQDVRHREAYSGDVLLVEDEEKLRGLIIRILEDVGFTVRVASNGEEALAHYDTHRDTIKLVITDVAMPAMNGIELAAHIQQRSKGQPILFMSGYTDTAIVEHGVLDEDTPFIRKPFDAPTFLGKVDEVLHPTPPDEQTEPT